MKVEMSKYLTSVKPLVKELVKTLNGNFEYASVLGTDVSGKSCQVRDKSSNVSDARFGERGFVARVYKDGRYYEYSFNYIDEESLPLIVEKIILGAAAAAQASSDIVYYPLIAEEEITQSFFGEIQIAPNSMTSGEKLDRLRDINKKAHEYSEFLVDFIASVTSSRVSKIFISEKKDMEQSYIYSEGMTYALVRRGKVSKTAFESYSGLKGLEILEEMTANIKNTVNYAVKLLDAKPMPPGEYEAIFAPKAVGVIAHEAFGHGVEMDMFVKNRAKAVEYIGKPVASEIVTMRDGAAAAKQVSSYLFDDEGTMGTDTVIIKDGILQTGISDLLSALKLGAKPTGNGKRQSFERKAYSRMTNTFIEPGKDKLEDMIASVKHGYFIEHMSSGMEDPKDWGIQVMFNSAEEIVDGKLTGNVFAPVIMTGYVPELLGNISMVSDDFELFGSGACGKGYKEWVKVSDGGPYIKTKARLG